MAPGRASYPGIGRRHQQGVELDVFKGEVDAQKPQQPVQLHEDGNCGRPTVDVVNQIEKALGHGESVVMLGPKEVNLDHWTAVRPGRLPFSWPWVRSG
jgi:hypothetical protein